MSAEEMLATIDAIRAKLKDIDWSAIEGFDCSKCEQCDPNCPFA